MRKFKNSFRKSSSGNNNEQREDMEATLQEFDPAGNNTNNAPNSPAYSAAEDSLLSVEVRGARMRMET